MSETNGTIPGELEREIRDAIEAFGDGALMTGVKRNAATPERGDG